VGGWLLGVGGEGWLIASQHYTTYALVVGLMAWFGTHVI
jgi:hypothetical protein